MQSVAGSVVPLAQSTSAFVIRCTLNIIHAPRSLSGLSGHPAIVEVRNNMTFVLRPLIVRCLASKKGLSTGTPRKSANRQIHLTQCEYRTDLEKETLRKRKKNKGSLLWQEYRLLAGSSITKPRDIMCKFF